MPLSTSDLSKDAVVNPGYLDRLNIELQAKQVTPECLTSSLTVTFWITDIMHSFKESYLNSPKANKKAAKTELAAIEAAIQRVHNVHRARKKPTGQTKYTFRGHGTLGLRLEVNCAPEIILILTDFFVASKACP